MENSSAILSKLASTEVDFLIVGGLAVNAHGHQRFTADIDLVILLEKLNLEKALGLLEKEGYTPRAPVSASDFANSQKRAQWIEKKNMTVFSLIHPQGHQPTIDIFAEYPFDYQACKKDAFTDQLPDGNTLHFASIHTLIDMKRKAGRPQDLIDISALEKLQNEIKSNSD